MVPKNLLPFSVDWQNAPSGMLPSTMIRHQLLTHGSTFFMKKRLMPGDEVVLYYRFDDHAWELPIRKYIEWDNDDINFDDWLFFNEQNYFVFFNILNNFSFCYHPTTLVFLSRLTCISNNILTTSSHNLQFLLKIFVLLSNFVGAHLYFFALFLDGWLLLFPKPHIFWCLSLDIDFVVCRLCLCLKKTTPLSASSSSHGFVQTRRFDISVGDCCVQLCCIIFNICISLCVSF